MRTFTIAPPFKGFLGTGLIIILLEILLLFLLPGSSVSRAQGGSAYFRHVRTFDFNDAHTLQPVGLTFLSEANTFLALEANDADQPVTGSSDLMMITPSEDVIGSMSLAISITDPINMVFDSKAHRLILFETTSRQLIELRTGVGGFVDTSTLNRWEAQALNLQDPQGMALDPATGQLFILDSVGPRLFGISPDDQQGFDVAKALAEGRVSQVDLSQTGLVDLRGLAFNPGNGHLYLLSFSRQELYELMPSGQLITTYDVAELELSNPQGLVFAPSGDQTDDPSVFNLYLANTGLNSTFTPAPDNKQLYLPLIIKSNQEDSTPANQAGGSDRAVVGSQEVPKPGHIVELSFVQPAQVSLLATTVTGTLVRTIYTSQFSTPSPDPSGLAYLPSENRLLISDGEVDEMPQYYKGKNLFETTLSGSLAKTSNTAFSGEPTGVAINVTNGHRFFSDDSRKKVFEVDLGTDGLFGTSDDVVTSFSTTAFGSTDPEGLAFGQGSLFIADGVNAEVYRVQPGANGRFDGVSPTGDDQVTHFDVLGLGHPDPEGIEYNPDSGTLFVTGHGPDTIIETTLEGALLKVINIAVINARKEAGLAYGPGSTNSAVKNLYLADRGQDNSTDPNENDGKIYEVSFDQSSPSPTSTPTRTPTPTSTPSTPSPTSTPTRTPTPTSTPLPLPAAVFRFSLSNSGTYSLGSLPEVRDEDILGFNGTGFTMIFDGSDVGVSAVDVDAFCFVDADTILMSFDNPVTLGTLGTIDDFDIVRFDATSLGANTAGTFSLYFDGSDVGLGTTDEDVDAIELLPDGRLLISTFGSFAVTGVSGQDEDLLAFSATSLGSTTSGTWSMYFDGSDVDLATSGGEDIDGVTIAANGAIYLTTREDFAVTGISGTNEDIFVCTPSSLGTNTACNYSSTLFFDGSVWGLSSNNLDGLELP